MKKLRNIILLLIVVVLLCGCSVKEQITINNDGTVVEKIYVSEDNSILIEQEGSVTEIVEEIARPYKEEILYNDYKYTNFSNIDSSGVEITKKYNNICNFFNDSLALRKVYNTVNCIENDDYYEISSNGVKVINSDNHYDVDKIVIKLKSSSDIIDSNATNVKDKIYEWDLNNSSSTKPIYIKIKKDSGVEKIVKSNTFSNVIKIIFAIIIICVLLSIISFILYKKNKKNRIEY